MSALYASPEKKSVVLSYAYVTECCAAQRDVALRHDFHEIWFHDAPLRTKNKAHSFRDTNQFMEETPCRSRFTSIRASAPDACNA